AKRMRARGRAQRGGRGPGRGGRRQGGRARAGGGGAVSAPAPSARGRTLYTFGGDDWIVAQLDQALGVGVNAPAQALTRHTPALAFSWGGAFAAIYPVQGAGGYHLLGICPVPVIDLSQTLPDFREDPFLHRAGDLHRYRPVDREEYDAIRAKVGEGTYAYTM